MSLIAPLATMFDGRSDIIAPMLDSLAPHAAESFVNTATHHYDSAVSASSLSSLSPSSSSSLSLSSSASTEEHLLSPSSSSSSSKSSTALLPRVAYAEMRALGDALVCDSRLSNGERVGEYLLAQWIVKEHRPKK